MSDIKWGVTQKNCPLLIIDGFEFTKKLETKSTTHWKCSKWRSHKCPKTAITADKELLASKHEHNHEFVPGKPEARQIVQTMKQAAKTNPVNSALIAESLQAVPSEFAIQMSLPSRAAMNKALNRQKAPIKESTHPITDRHFEVPAEFQDFCLFDSGKEDSERVLIFGDKDTVKSLQVYNSLWLADGTFKICPPHFYQLYTIHIEIGGFYPPWLYALLSNKQEGTYKKFLDGVSQLTEF